MNRKLTTPSSSLWKKHRYTIQCGAVITVNFLQIPYKKNIPFLSPIVARYEVHVISVLTWGRVMYICVSKLTIIGSDNGLSPGWRQAIIWTNAGILLIGPLGINFSEILITILTFSFKKMHLKLLSAKWQPFCLGFNVLRLRFIFCPNAVMFVKYQTVSDHIITTPDCINP